MGSKIGYRGVVRKYINKIVKESIMQLVNPKL